MEIDWVTALHECSVFKVFQTLRHQVEADVNARNGIRGTAPGYVYRINNDLGEQKFAVFIEGQGLSAKSIYFLVEESRIVVKNGDGATIVGGDLTLNENGECRLLVDGQEREFWQFRKMALEGLFFRVVRPTTA